MTNKFKNIMYASKNAAEMLENKKIRVVYEALLTMVFLFKKVPTI